MVKLLGGYPKFELSPQVLLRTDFRRYVALTFLYTLNSFISFLIRQLPRRLAMEPCTQTIGNEALARQVSL